MNPTSVDVIWSTKTHSPGLVATNTSWLALLSLPYQGSLVITPKRQPAHLGGSTLAILLRKLPVEGKLLELGGAQVTKAVMPLHELGLFVGGLKLDVFGFLGQR
jgi:hypothetical protein